MGQLRTRKRGKTWEWSFEGAKIAGKRTPISKSGSRTKAEALESGTQAKAEYDRGGQRFTPSEVSVADYTDYWLENYAKENLAYNTYLDYERKVRIHIKPHLGHYRLCTLNPETIQNWVNNLKDGMSKSMVQNTLTCLSGALQYAILPCKYIMYNPCQGVKIGKVNESCHLREHREYILPCEEYHRIITRFNEQTNFYIPLVVGYNIGTRIGESYGFDLLKDVDFTSHEAHVKNQLKKEYGVWCYRPPKYDSYRTIKMGKTIEKELHREISRRKENMLRYGQYFTRSYINDNSELIQLPANVEVALREIMPISVKENGDILTPESFKHCARVVHNELGNPLFHSHCLRHTHGTILAENGANPKTIMERLGHKDVKTTMNTYVFNTDQMQQQAVDIFETAIS